MAKSGQLIDLQEFYEHFSGETDRACGVLGAAFLDEQLATLYRCRLVEKADDLLQPSGTLGSFGTRCKVAFALGWIDKETYADLELVRKIRNDFAHLMDHKLSFSDASIADRTRALASSNQYINSIRGTGLTEAAIEKMKASASPPKERFIIGVGLLGTVLTDLLSEQSVALCDVVKRESRPSVVRSTRR